MSQKRKSTEFLLECMADSLILLMKEKEYNKITINEITEKSGVGRATYFRHVKSKEDLIVYKFKFCWEQWAKELGLRTYTGFVLENMETFFDFNYANREWILLAYQAGQSQTLLSAFNAIFLEQKEVNDQHYADAFFKYGLFGVMNTWISNGFKESPEEMVKIGRNIVSYIGSDEAQTLTYADINIPPK